MSCEGVGVTGAVICNAIAGTPGEEICSGYDDDCDGVVDEGLDCPTNTPTFTNTITSTNTTTFTNSNTYTKTFTATKTFTPSKTLTLTFTPTKTETATLTNTIPLTYTPTLENTKIVTPELRLKKPVEEKKIKDHVKIKFEEFDGASLEDNATKIDTKTYYKYLIHIRKLKRLGHKDKNYQLGRKKLSLQKTNLKTFKNLDKGIYSVRYRIIITNNNITRKTKWSGRNLIIF